MTRRVGASAPENGAESAHLHADEHVVLLDETGNAIGTAAKSEVHHDHTPLHLAFSCYVFDPTGRLLVTQRARHKPTWPRVWTNSFCGHPAPGEDLSEAVRRRGRQELGIGLDELQLVLPRFHYQATMPNGVRENELCPVFTAVTSEEPRPDRGEVETAVWLAWGGFRDEVLTGRRDVSPWCATQVTELAAVETAVARFESAPEAHLPPAARG